MAHRIIEGLPTTLVYVDGDQCQEIRHQGTAHNYVAGYVLLVVEVRNQQPSCYRVLFGIVGSHKELVTVFYNKRPNGYGQVPLGHLHEADVISGARINSSDELYGRSIDFGPLTQEQADFVARVTGFSIGDELDIAEA